MADELYPIHEDGLDDASLEALALAVATPAPAALRARVLDAVEQQARLERARRSLLRWRAGGALAAAAALVLGLLYTGQVRETEDARRIAHSLRWGGPDLLAELQDRQEEIIARGEALRVHAEIIRIMASPQLRTALLAPRSGHTGSARALLDPESGAVALVGAGLPPAEPGEVYELWALRGEVPERAGRFASDPERRNFALRLQHVASPGEVTAFAVSLESEPGRDEPEGPIILIGSVGS